MRKYILDCSKMTDPKSAHEYIARVLGFPDYYGKNLDALYDCLTDMGDCEIIFANKDRLKEPCDGIPDFNAIFADAASDNPHLIIKDEALSFDSKELLDNIDKLHTTLLGAKRIKKNLKIAVPDVVEHCKKIILSDSCNIYRRGKNWYCESGGLQITVNAMSYTIITAHILHDK